MGEYGTPNIDIEEGWIDIRHNKRREKFLSKTRLKSLSYIKDNGYRFDMVLYSHV